MAAAEQLKAFCASFLCALHINQLQLDELYAVWRGVKEGESSAKKASKRLERSRHWVWTAIEIGPRTLAMAQRVVHHVVQTLVPACVPLCWTDGYRDYTTAILSHFGFWHQPSRQRAQGPAPKPRWMPLPGLLYAQVIKQYRHRRMVGVKHRVVFGTQLAVAQVLTACGWRINIIHPPHCVYVPRYRGKFLYLDRRDYGRLSPICRLEYTGKMETVVIW